MNKFKTLLVGAVVASLAATSAMAQEKIRIAFIDPLSGPFASTGNQGLSIYRHAVDELVNKKGALLNGAADFEIVHFRQQN